MFIFNILFNQCYKILFDKIDFIAEISIEMCSSHISIVEWITNE